MAPRQWQQHSMEESSAKMAGCAGKQAVGEASTLNYVEIKGTPVPKLLSTSSLSYA
jgi:hypothetical protein